MRLRAGVGLIALAVMLGMLLWLFLDEPEVLPGPRSPVGVLDPASARGPERTVERVVAPEPELEPAPRTPLDEAFAGLVEVTEGFAIACPAPPELDAEHPPLADRLVRPVLDGRTFRAVVRSPEGVAPVKRWLPRKCAPDGPDASPDCEEAPRYEGPLFAVAWSGGVDGEASCRFEPLTEVRVAGRVVRRDGGPVNPQTVGVAGCGARMAEDGTFEGSMTRYVGCTLIGTGPHAMGSVVEIRGDVPTTGIEFVVAPPTMYGPTPEGLAAMKHGEEALAERVVDETAEVQVLRDPDLSPEARALVHAWVEANEAEATERLRIMNMLNDIVRRSPSRPAPPPE